MIDDIILVYYLKKGDFDVKNINFADLDDDDDENCNKPDLVSVGYKLGLTSDSSYKDLNENQLKNVIEFIIDLDKELSLFNLEFNKLDNKFISNELGRKNECHKKHMRQISSIVSHVEALMENVECEKDSRCCMVELGAGRGRLSYWFEESRKHKCATESKPEKCVNILLIERGSQRLKFDNQLKKNLEEMGEFERIQIDLKDLFINKIPLIQKSSNFILYGKHLCGCGTDFSLRCLKNSLESGENFERLKFSGLVLAVCCHHVCEWDSLCGKKFLKSKGIDSTLFYIIRSISSWSTSGDRNITPPQEYIFGHQRQKVGRICKNLIDYARIQYLKEIQLPPGYFLNCKQFYYIEPEVTLENSIIYARLDFNKNE